MATRIPKSIDRFNDYISNTDTHQLAGTPDNYTRWNWTAAESAAWTAFKTQFTPLYGKYSDKKVSRTTDIKDRLRQIIKKCMDYDKEHHLLDRIASSPDSINTDYEIFNIRRGTPLAKKTNSTRTESIREQCNAIARSLGGGFMKISCRSSGNTKRPSKVAGTNSIKIFFKIGDTAPANASDGTKTEIFTKAIFIIQCGDENVEKKLHIYTQWYNTKHPELAGPVSSLQSVLIA